GGGFTPETWKSGQATDRKQEFQFREVGSAELAQSDCSVAVAASAQSCRGSFGSEPKLVTTGPCVALREDGEAVSAAGPIWFKLASAHFRAKRSAGAIMAVPPPDRPRHAGFRPREARRSAATCNGSAAP